MKKIKLVILVLTVFSLSLSLYGCAKSIVNNYHSYSYYKKHIRQAKIIDEACMRLGTLIMQGKRKIPSLKVNKNCENAFNAVRTYGITYAKPFKMPKKDIVINPAG